MPDGSFVDDLSMAWFSQKVPANRVGRPTRMERR